MDADERGEFVFASLFEAMDVDVDVSVGVPWDILK